MTTTLLISGTSGIGAAAARLALAEGARVFLVGLEPPELDCPHLVGDLREPGVAEEAVARALALFGTLDGLFNVAGASGRRAGDGPLHACTDEGWAFTMGVNLETTFRLSRAALRPMLERRRGAIVHTTSALALAPEPEGFATHAYAAAKGALLSLTRAMAAHYAPHGIRVNAIAPGLVRTPMSRRAQQDEALVARVRARQPLAGDLLEPAAVARAALFLLGDGAAAITGDVLTVDGGWTVS